MHIVEQEKTEKVPRFFYMHNSPLRHIQLNILSQKPMVPMGYNWQKWK